MIKSEIETLLEASLNLIELRHKVKEQAETIANLRIRLQRAEARLQSDFELSGDCLPALLRRQI